MTQRAVVFGAGGGIGGALTDALLAAGWSVAAGARRWHDVDASAGDVERFTFDLLDEGSLARVAATFAGQAPEMVIVATGRLTSAETGTPEKTYRELSTAHLAEAYAVNAIGPALVAKHMLPLFPRDRRAVFAALSARVGSISDNRLGGWHAYRASKAALNMLLRNLALELARTHKHAVVAGLHPGTVNTRLSQPFQRGVPPDQLHSPEQAARDLLGVIDKLTPNDSGGVFDWRGERIPA